MHDGLAVVIAWPETRCKQAGAWYDPILSFLRINRNGYYKIGHAAIVLIKKDSSQCHYFDFGRYHSPHGNGRVRSGETDHDLLIRTVPVFNNGSVVNIREIISELSENSSCHGSGKLYAAVTGVYFDKAFSCALRFQEKEFLPYGPFVWNGTNCSRFVAGVLAGGRPDFLIRMGLYFPATISPSPYWNVILASGFRKSNLLMSGARLTLAHSGE